ncbi:HAMP domain-containing protein [Novosphingobium sp. 9]|uniref:HAMP domain-containing protein n=1 Tax=Novosphingobium sp. 9 TaxID=2025349 RepID=UPI0021B6BA7F|nr:HAMP domain-containing protein [Novosphingobium sp. 9]
MTRILRSLSFRLALTYAGMLCISMALLMGAGYWLRVTMPMEEQRAAVETEAQLYAAELAKSGMEPVARMLERRDHQAGARKPFHALIAPDGTVISSNLPSWPPHGNDRFTIIEADNFLDGFEIDYSSLTRDILMPDGTRLLVGRDVDDIVRDQNMLQTAALWILCGTMVLGLSGGWVMSHAIGKRLEAVTKAARQVMDGDLSGRIRVRGTNDDFDRLGETLNLMLSRIQTLFESTRRVSDNVAHELRTPLARLVGQLEDIEQRAGTITRCAPRSRPRSTMPTACARYSRRCCASPASKAGAIRCTFRRPTSCSCWKTL